MEDQTTVRGTAPRGGAGPALAGGPPATRTAGDPPTAPPAGGAPTKPAATITKTWRQRLRADWPLVAMTLPAIGLLLVFHYAPLLGNVIAFQDYSPFVGIRDSQFVGFWHFSRFFTDPLFWRATGNTLLITAFQLVFFFPVPIALALLLNSILNSRVRVFVQSVVYLPHFFSWVLVITLFQQILGGAGLVSQILRESGNSPLGIMTDPDTFILLVTSEMVWKDAGWGTIIFLAALSTVNQSLYEAAAADGAGRWRRTWHITLPALRPVIVLLLILRLGDALTVGFEQFILQRNAVGSRAAEVLDTYVYYTGIVNGDYSYAAAVGLFKGLFGLALILAANRIAHVFGEQGVYSRS
ncbi:ABC transporter permease [Allostreptomyces psammosilenae]|uniref:Putative aldouronate transport system permease protein n=1 Tax=Allostreptomyces psammosilenae TaxID=1892865 RepID=A0A853A0R7_9ACTN|nr:ABC transporter permease subunit [Allostreptomyces psammosilenae]NYI04411.1 putative aldouronate transport system permease protein [Allostreptomyces psammosilenae]